MKWLVLAIVAITAVATDAAAGLSRLPRPYQGPQANLLCGDLRPSGVGCPVGPSTFGGAYTDASDHAQGFITQGR